LESPEKDGKMWCNRMLLAFCAVATGSCPLMIEHCRGRRYRRPRPDLGCSAIGWMDGWMELNNCNKIKTKFNPKKLK
jgi:hypothetical protein